MGQDFLDMQYLCKVLDTHPLVEPVEAGGVVGGEEGRGEPAQLVRRQGHVGYLGWHW